MDNQQPFFAKQSPPQHLVDTAFLSATLWERSVTSGASHQKRRGFTTSFNDSIGWAGGLDLSVLYCCSCISPTMVKYAVFAFFCFLGVSPVGMCRTDHPSSTILENISSKLSRLKVLHAALVGWKIPCRKVWHETKEYELNCCEQQGSRHF